MYLNKLAYCVVRSLFCGIVLVQVWFCLKQTSGCTSKKVDSERLVANEWFAQYHDKGTSLYFELCVNLIWLIYRYVCLFHILSHMSLHFMSLYCHILTHTIAYFSWTTAVSAMLVPPEQQSRCLASHWNGTARSSILFNWTKHPRAPLWFIHLHPFTLW